MKIALSVLGKLNEEAFQKIWDVFLKYRENTVPYYETKNAINKILMSHSLKICKKVEP